MNGTAAKSVGSCGLFVGLSLIKEAFAEKERGTFHLNVGIYDNNSVIYLFLSQIVFGIEVLHRWP